MNSHRSTTTPYLVQQPVDLALATHVPVLERIRLCTVEVRLTRAGDKNAREALAVPDREHILVRAEPRRRQRAVRDRMCEIERWLRCALERRVYGRLRVHLEMKRERPHDMRVLRSLR
jgi:hypothetical protein